MDKDCCGFALNSVYCYFARCVKGSIVDSMERSEAVYGVLCGSKKCYHLCKKIGVGIRLAAIWAVGLCCLLVGRHFMVCVALNGTITVD